MDGKRFDQLTRGLATASHRRGFLKGMAAAAAGFIGLRTADAVDAACQPGGWYCRFNSECCSGRCNANRTCCTPHTATQTCAGKCGQVVNNCGQSVTCPTPSGTTCCGGVPTTIGTTTNCGSCGDACAPGFICDGGVCKCDADSDCGAGRVCCNGACSVCCGTNVSNCDTNKCNTYTCNAGTCVSSGLIICLPNPTDRPCYDQACNPATGNCENTTYHGDGSACGPITTGNGKICCSGDCIPNDEENCGSCGNECAPGFVCDHGVCECDADSDCGTGNVCCDGVCKQCCDADDCAAPADPCKLAICTAGVCGEGDKNDGELCNTTGACQAGTCCGCIIDGACIAHGASNPDNLCQECRPRILTVPPYVADNDTWSAKICAGEFGECSGPVCDPGTGICGPGPINEGGACQELSPMPCRDSTGTCVNGQCIGGAIENGAGCTTQGTFCASADGTCLDGACVGAPLNEGQLCGSVIGDPLNPCSTELCVQGVCTKVVNEEAVDIQGCSEVPGNPCRAGVCAASGDCVEQNIMQSGASCEGPSLCENYICAAANPQGDLHCQYSSKVDCGEAPAGCLDVTCNQTSGACEYTYPEPGTRVCDSFVVNGCDGEPCPRPCCPGQNCSPPQGCELGGCGIRYCY